MKKLIIKSKEPSGTTTNWFTPRFLLKNDTIVTDPKNPSYDGTPLEDDYIKEFFENDYLPRFKRENPNATDKEIEMLTDVFNNTNHTHNKKPGMMGLTNEEGIEWFTPLSGEDPRWMVAHELLGHRLRQYGLGTLSNSEFSSDNLGKYLRTNSLKTLGNLGGLFGMQLKYGSGSGYSPTEQKYLRKGYSNLMKRNFGDVKGDNKDKVRELIESGAINTLTRYKIWRSLKSSLNRIPTLDEVDTAIRALPEKIIDMYMSGDGYTNEWTNPEAKKLYGSYESEEKANKMLDKIGKKGFIKYDSKTKKYNLYINRYLGGINDYNALKESMIHVAQNNTQNNEDVAYAKSGKKLIPRAKSGTVANFLKLLISLGYDLGKTGADGFWGSLTLKAWEKALKDGYINLNGNIIKSNVENKKSKYTTQTLVERLKIGETILLNSPENIKKAMKTTKGNYTVIDKKRGNVLLWSNGKLLKTYSSGVGFSANIGDGYAITPAGADGYKSRTRTTGAGVYTISRVSMPGDGTAEHYYDKEPVIQLKNAKGKKVTTAIHGRVSGGNSGTRTSMGGNGSGGCIRLPNGLVIYNVNNGFFNEGDSVLVLPEEEGNIMSYNNGKFTTTFNNKSLVERMPTKNVLFNEDPNIFESIVNWFK